MPRSESSRPQQTIGQPVGVVGKSLHTGEVTSLRLLSAKEDSGIRFRRSDLPGTADIPATLDHIVTTDALRRTALACGDADIHTVEHLLASAYACGVDNLVVEVNGPELPFIDGSAQPYVELLNEAGIVQQTRPVDEVLVDDVLVFRDGKAEIVVLPSREFRVTFFYTSDHPLLRRQSATVGVTPGTFAAEVAPARTFCFFSEIEELQRRGLIRGGNLSSSVVIGRKSILNNSLRYPDEPVRHKILDFIGDLALLGKPVKGHFLAWRSGHRTNAAFGLYLRKELDD